MSDESKLVLAVVLALIVLFSTVTILVLASPWRFMFSEMIEHMSGEDSGPSELYEKTVLTGTVYNITINGLVVRGDREYYIPLTGNWIIRFKNGTVVEAPSKEVMSRYIFVNESVVITGYMRMEPRGMIVEMHPLEIEFTNGNYTMKPLQPFELPSEECPCHMGDDH